MLSSKNSSGMSITPMISSASDSMVGALTVSWPTILERLPADSTSLESKVMLRQEISVLTIGILLLSRRLGSVPLDFLLDSL